MIKQGRLGSSFRDKSGYIYQLNNNIYRTVNYSFKDDFDLFMSSGLYNKLQSQSLLIEHHEVSPKIIGSGKFKSRPTSGSVSRTDPDPPTNYEAPAIIYKLLEAQKIPFISYPYEWSRVHFYQAAKLTLAIQKIALSHQMTLKDASAYNVQFIGPKPIFIDTLSFEKLTTGAPWVAYRQFCQHFLAPLSLMKYCDVRLGKINQLFLDGIDLDLVVSLLPKTAYLNFHLLMHLYLHQKSKKITRSTESKLLQKFTLGRQDLLRLIDSLDNALESVNTSVNPSHWANYYSNNNYKVVAFKSKQKLVKKILQELKPAKVWDLGANTGIFSWICAKLCQYVIAIDSDPALVELNFIEAQKRKINNLLPLLVDLTNPTPAIGWENQERLSLGQRANADLILALALVHHLYFANNLSFADIAYFFQKLGEYLIIEFVPRQDSQIDKLIGFKNLDYSDYQEKNFEKAFLRYYQVLKKINIPQSLRILYLMKRIK